ncbi:MAG TPA: flippase [Anaerolineae bacterium]
MRQFSLTVLRNSIFGAVAQLGIKVLSFAFSILVIRRLGAQAFGQYSAVLAFGSIFAVISDLGLSAYSVRQIARSRDDPTGMDKIQALYSNVLALRLLLSVFTAVVLILAAWLTGRPSVMVAAIALNTLGLIMYAVQGSSDAALAGFERLDVAAGAKVLNQFVFVVAGAVVLWLGWGYFGLIIANLLAIACMTWMCWRAVRSLGVRPGRVARQVWPTLLRVSLPFGVIGFALGLSYKFDSVLLNIYRGDAETGYYSAVYNLIFSAVLLSNVFNTALYPSLARQAVSAPHRLPVIYEHALRYLMALSLPIAVGTWVLAEQIVPFLFDAAYLPSVPAFQILIWVVPLMFASEFLGYVVVISGQEQHVARAIIVSTGLNVIMNLLLVPQYGFIAASMMTLATEAVLVGQYVWMLRALLRKMNLGTSLVRPLLAALCMGALMFLLRSSVPLLVNITLGVVAYFVLAWLLGVLGKEEWRLIRNMHSSAEITGS